LQIAHIGVIMYTVGEKRAENCTIETGNIYDF